MKETLTVLLIEDSLTQAKRIAARLASYEIEVLIAGDSPEGLRMVDEYDPDLILLDLYLPSMNGYQVCQRLQRDRNTAHIPIIMLTSADSADSMLEGLESGAADYIPKDDFVIENLLTSLASFGLIEAVEVEGGE